MGYDNKNDCNGKEITLERVVEFYEFLQGKLPDGMGMPAKPKLTQRKAFKIIWYLQEHANLIPDNFERCCRCGDIYDINLEGNYKGDQCYCDSCYRHVFLKNR